jgi:hypothetical protein
MAVVGLFSIIIGQPPKLALWFGFVVWMCGDALQQSFPLSNPEICGRLKIENRHEVAMTVA